MVIKRTQIDAYMKLLNCNKEFRYHGTVSDSSLLKVPKTDIFGIAFDGSRSGGWVFVYEPALGWSAESISLASC
jgi:hypothetical protein